MIFRFLKIERLLFFEKILNVQNKKPEYKTKINVKIVLRDNFSKILAKFRELPINVEQNYGIADLCAILEINGKPVHIRGVMLNKIDIMSIERKIRIDSDSAFLYGAYTVPEYRRQGMAQKVTDEIFCYLKQIGIRKVYAYIKKNNLPSLRYARKVGYRRIGEVKFLKILKLRLYTFKGETKHDYDTLNKIFSKKSVPQ